MRFVKGMTALAVVLALAGSAAAGADPLTFIGSLFNTPPATSTQQPVAQPQLTSRGPFGLTNMLPNPTPLSNQQVIGFSTFPTQSQMPGAGWLAAFGFQHPAVVDTYRPPGSCWWWGFWHSH
jgi:hypothetical protein